MTSFPTAITRSEWRMYAEIIDRHGYFYAAPKLRVFANEAGRESLAAHVGGRAYAQSWDCTSFVRLLFVLSKVEEHLGEAQRIRAHRMLDLLGLLLSKPKAPLAEIEQARQRLRGKSTA